MKKISYAYDVETLPNYFSVVFVDTVDYLKKMEAVDENNKPVELVDKYKINDIKCKLDSVNKYQFAICDFDYSDLQPLRNFIINFRNNQTTLFGFNSDNYDNLMITYFMMISANLKTKEDVVNMLLKINDFSKVIIETKDVRFSNNPAIKTVLKERLPFFSCDVQSLFALDTKRKSLKQTSINLKWYNLLEFDISDYPITEEDAHYYRDSDRHWYLEIDEMNEKIGKWDRYITPKVLPIMSKYNTNDVYIVCEIIRLKIEEIVLRFAISSEYKVDVLSKARASIANILMTKFYSEFSGLDRKEFKDLKTYRKSVKLIDCINSKVWFKDPELIVFLSRLKRVELTSTKGDFNEAIEYKGTTYTFAAGGLHSKDKSEVLISTDEYQYIDADVESYYPRTIQRLNIIPQHLDRKAWAQLISLLIEGRVEAKRNGEKVKAEVLKIVINSGLYGKLNFEMFWLYDPKAAMTVTINGQLFLLMLIERLEAIGVHVVSANTDGIVSKVPSELKDEYDRVCKEWETELNYKLEFTPYKKYIRRDVNSYISIKYNNSIKFKGALNPNLYLEDLTKGFDSPIIPKAVAEYFINNIPIMTTLKNAKSILDFCKTKNVQKATGIYAIEVINGETTMKRLNRGIRYYVSNSGLVITTCTETKSNPLKGNRLCAGQYVRLLLEADDTDISMMDINYLYYYNEIIDIVNNIENRKYGLWN